MVGWHHRLNGCEFEQILGDGEGQGSLACCSLWGQKGSDTTEQLNSKSVLSVSPLLLSLLLLLCRYPLVPPPVPSGSEVAGSLGGPRSLAPADLLLGTSLQPGASVIPFHVAGPWHSCHSWGETHRSPER